MMRLPGLDCVVPPAVEAIWRQVHDRHLVVRNLESHWVAAPVQSAGDLQALGRRRRSDEADDRFVVTKGLPAPVRGDEGERPVLDLVPLARPGREMADLDRESDVVGQTLELELPLASAVAVAPASVRCDQKRLGLRVQTPPLEAQPPSDRRYSEGARVVVGPDAHE